MNAELILDGFVLFVGALVALLIAVAAAGAITTMYKMFRSADKDMTVTTEGTVKVLKAEEGKQ